MTIKVYTTTTCAYCRMVKQFLDMKKHVYEYINLDEHPELQQEVIEKSGATTVPVTIVKHDDGREIPIIGYNLQSLSHALSLV